MIDREETYRDQTTGETVLALQFGLTLESLIACRFFLRDHFVDLLEPKDKDSPKACLIIQPDLARPQKASVFPYDWMVKRSSGVMETFEEGLFLLIFNKMETNP